MSVLPDDIVYFLHRSEQHRVLAERCADGAQRLVHQRFADIYKRRAAGEVVQGDQVGGAKILGTT